jgi:hypothetical protein
VVSLAGRLTHGSAEAAMVEPITQRRSGEGPGLVIVSKQCGGTFRRFVMRIF